MISTRTGSLPGNLRTSNHLKAASPRRQVASISCHFQARIQWESPPPPRYSFMKLRFHGPSGTITLQWNSGTEINGADRQNSSVHLYMYISCQISPPRTVISHSTNTSVESTGNVVTSQFVVTKALRRFRSWWSYTFIAMLIIWRNKSSAKIIILNYCFGIFRLAGMTIACKPSERLFEFNKEYLLPAQKG